MHPPHPPQPPQPPTPQVTKVFAPLASLDAAIEEAKATHQGLEAKRRNLGQTDANTSERKQAAEAAERQKAEIDKLVGAKEAMEEAIKDCKHFSFAELWAKKATETATAGPASPSNPVPPEGQGMQGK